LKGKIDSRRSEFLKQLAPLSPVPLPTSEVHKDLDTGIYYEINTYIPGVSFYPVIAQIFSPSEFSVISQKLGAFFERSTHISH